MVEWTAVCRMFMMMRMRQQYCEHLEEAGGG